LQQQFSEDLFLALQNSRWHFPNDPKTKRHRDVFEKTDFSSAGTAATFFTAVGARYRKLHCAAHENFAFVFMLPRVDVSNIDVFTWVSQHKLLLESVGEKSTWSVIHLILI